MQCKDNANRVQKRQTCLSDYAEMQLILYKDTANRAQKRQTCLSDYAEMQLILYKDTANRAQERQTWLGDFLCKSNNVNGRERLYKNRSRSVFASCKMKFLKSWNCFMSYWEF